MKFGAQVSAYRTSWDDIRSVVETMDAGRWSSVWFADHFVPPNRPRDQEPLPAYEAMALAGAAASITETLRIGHLVLGNTYRNPRARGQDRRQHRPHLARPLRAGHRRLLVPARA